jgi:uncharacterized membrane protein
MSKQPLESHEDLQQRSLSDERMDQIIGNLLRLGVIVSALVVFAGGIVYLTRHGKEQGALESLQKWDKQAEPEELRSPGGILHKCVVLSGRGFIMLGLLLLVATPVARVIFSTAAFAVQRDYLYVLFTLVVLAVLLYSLFSGYFWDRGG